MYNLYSYSLYHVDETSNSKLSSDLSVFFYVYIYLQFVFSQAALFAADLHAAELAPQASGGRTQFSRKSDRGWPWRGSYHRAEGSIHVRTSMQCRHACLHSFCWYSHVCQRMRCELMHLFSFSFLMIYLSLAFFYHEQRRPYRGEDDDDIQDEDEDDDGEDNVFGDDSMSEGSTLTEGNAIENGDEKASQTNRRPPLLPLLPPPSSEDLVAGVIVPVEDKARDEKGGNEDEDDEEVEEEESKEEEKGTRKGELTLAELEAAKGLELQQRAELEAAVRSLDIGGEQIGAAHGTRGSGVEASESE